MITIKSVNPTGLFSYGLHETVPLDQQGVVLLTGDNSDRLAKTANGAGKTSLLNIIAHILFGENPTGKGDTEIVNSVLGKGCWGKVEFQIGLRLYRIIMARSWKGPYPDPTTETEPCVIHENGDRYDGTELYFDEKLGDKWIDMRLGKSAETRKRIISILGMTYDHFLATSYLAQKRGLAFISGKNKDRMQLITELTDMSVWDRANQCARAQHKETEGKLGWARSKLATLESNLSVMAQPMSQDALKQLDIRMTDLQRNKIEFVNTVSTLEAQYNEAAVNVERHRSKLAVFKGQIESCTLELGRYRMEGVRLATRRQHAASEILSKATEREDTTELRNKVAILSNMVDQYVHSINNASGPGQTCGSCGTDITPEMYERHAAELKFKLMATRDELSDTVAKLSEMTARNNEYIKQQATELENSIDFDISANKSAESNCYDASIALSVQYKELEDTIVKLGASAMAIYQQISLTKIRIHEIESGIKEVVMTKSANAGLADLYNNTMDEIVSTSAVIQELEETLKYDVALIKMTSDKGIKAHKFGSIIATLNDLVKDNIDILTDGQVQVWFSPWKEKAKSKNEEDVVAEIQIFVREGPKDEVDLALYSGAEQQQIILAIIRAFNQLSIMQGGGTNILALDEIFGMFDDASASTAIHFIDKIKESNWGTILLITHSDFVKSHIDYSQIWVATKRNHITTLKRS